VLRVVGFRLDPPGRNPKHFTVAFDDFDSRLNALIACELQIWPNAYHQG